MCCPQLSLNLEVELDNDPGSFKGSATNRKCTDVFGFIIVLLFFGAVIGLSTYCILNSDIEKVLNGYDDEGNICGRYNSKPDGSVENMEQKKYVFIKEDAVLGKTKECVQNCTKNGTFLVSNYCVSDTKFIPYHIEMLRFWKYVLILCLFSIILAMIYLLLIIPDMRILLKLFIKCIFPTILFLSLALSWLCIAYAIVEKVYYHFKVSVILTIIITIAFVSYMSTFRTKQHFLKKELAAQFIQKIAEVTDVIPLIWALPLLFSILIAGFTIVLIFCWVWLQSVSYLEIIRIGSSNVFKNDYVQYPIATVTGGLVIYAYLLLIEIVKNCQCMIIGGCVAQWYFTKRDVEVCKLIKRTITNQLKYHLGTICFGSLILPIVYVLRSVLNGIKGAASGYNKESVYTCSCRLLSETCLATPITCLDCFSQNGFIMTAMYGCSFCEGSIRAHKLISHNNFNVAAINSLGNYLLDALTSLITIASLACFGLLFSSGYMEFTNERHVPIMMISFVMLSYILIDCFISSYKVANDTLFLCFCEDILYNNGTAKPYYVTSEFAELIEDANIFVDPVKWEDVADKWEKGPGRLY